MTNRQQRILNGHGIFCERITGLTVRVEHYASEEPAYRICVIVAGHAHFLPNYKAAYEYIEGIRAGVQYLNESKKEAV